MALSPAGNRAWRIERFLWRQFSSTTAACFSFMHVRTFFQNHCHNEPYPHDTTIDRGQPIAPSLVYMNNRRDMEETQHVSIRSQKGPL